MESEVGRHLHSLEWAPHSERPPDVEQWPYTVPVVAQLVAGGSIEIPAGVTFIVGENGSGKSTLVEAMAAAYPRRGYGTAGVGASPEDSPLRWHIRLRTDPRASPAGFFLRAETMHGYLGAVDDSPASRRAWDGEQMQTRSHGESFLAVMRLRFGDVGMYFMDEPEAALSFQSCLGVIALLAEMRAEGSQVVIATHSPLLMSLPGATILEVGDWGIRRAANFGDIELVQSWRTFLATPDRYLRHLTD